MANEDIIKKDLVTELKDMQEENNNSHLVPVNVVIGRFQPFTIGHLGMAKELNKINGLPSVYIYIRSKSGENSKFSDNLTINYMEDVIKGQPLVKDAWAMTGSFIPVIIKETQRRGYNPVLIGAGEDRAKSYESMAKKMKDITTHPDFKIQELKGRLTSATEVRKAILDGDEKTFKKLTPNQIHPYYKQLKAELEKSGQLVESFNVSDILDNIDISIDEAETILESYNENFFSDALIIESILEYELQNKIEKMEIQNLTEASMSDIHLIAHESKDFKEFRIRMKKEYPSMKESDMKQMYDEMMEMGESVSEGYTAKVGDKLTHKYDKTITIELIEPTNKGWKVKQFDKKGKSKTAFFDKQDITGDRSLFESINEARLPKLKFKTQYPIYHDTFGSALNAISKYVDDAGYSIDDNDFFIAFGDAFFKPKKGKTLSKTVEIRDKNGNVIGNLHAQIYNKGTDGNTYELNVYTDQIMRGLKESKTDENIFKLVLQHVSSIHENSLLKAHTRLFERAIMIRNNEISFDDLDNKAEKEIMSYFAKIDESKLTKFKNYLNEMIGSSDYEAKIDAAVSEIVNTNRPIVWEDFKSNMIRSDFFKKEFKPFLMMQGLNDLQIERFIENVLRVKYQHYSNFYRGNGGNQYFIQK